MQAGGRLGAPARYHVTLLFLGDAVTTQAEAAAMQAASLLRSPPFTLRLEQGGSFRSRQIPWWLGPRDTPAELFNLHAQLRDALRNAGVSYDRTHLAPHLTVLRDARKPLPLTPIEPIRWNVTEFALVRSLLDAQSPQYHVVSHWPLKMELTKRTGSAQLELWENDRR